MSLDVPVCSRCGRAVFPPRLLCPECGGTEWRSEPVEHGVVERATERDGMGVCFVRTPLGPLVVARLEQPAERGAEVTLDVDGGAPVARPR